MEICRQWNVMPLLLWDHVNEHAIIIFSFNLILTNRRQVQRVGAWFPGRLGRSPSEKCREIIGSGNFHISVFQCKVDEKWVSFCSVFSAPIILFALCIFYRLKLWIYFYDRLCKMKAIDQFLTMQSSWSFEISMVQKLSRRQKAGSKISRVSFWREDH